MVALRSAPGRWIVAVTALGSGLVMLDSSVVTVALPAIGADLGAGLGGLQWTVTGYTLTLAAFILLAGSLSDRFGRRAVFVWGTAGFGLTSLLCAVSGDIGLLVAARILQGVAGALLTPGSLALISATIDPADRGAAVGLWSGFGGVAAAVGPPFGGWLVEVAGWRSVFLINLPLAVLVVVAALRHVPESRDPDAAAGFDVPGTALATAGLAALSYGLIERHPVVSLLGLVSLAGFVVVESRAAYPLVRMTLFRSRLFTATNVVTFAVYAALGAVIFLLALQLQLVVGYSPLFAGLAAAPVVLLMLVLSPGAGMWAQRHGPRLPMTVGPLLAAVGLLLIGRIGPGAAYLTDVLPGVTVFGLGLSALVAPLTTAVLDAVPVTEAGIASGVNNAVSRTAQLLAVAALPGLAGIGTDSGPAEFAAGFPTTMAIGAGLLVVGGVLAFLLVRSPE